MEEDIRQIKLAVSAAPTAGDMWLALIFLSAQLGFGFKWWLFAIIVAIFLLEKIAVMHSVHQFIKWKKARE